MCGAHVVVAGAIQAVVVVQRALDYAGLDLRLLTQAEDMSKDRCSPRQLYLFDPTFISHLSADSIFSKSFTNAYVTGGVLGQ